MAPNRHGSVLRPATLATMFGPHYRAHPRLAGMGLGFFRHDAGGHRLVGHDGILPGFNSGLLVAPDDGVGVIGFTNGSTGAMVWLPTELERLLRRLLDVRDELQSLRPYSKSTTSRARRGRRRWLP